MKPFCYLLFLFFVVCTEAYAQPDLKHSFLFQKNSAIQKTLLLEVEDFISEPLQPKTMRCTE
ncbi:MAG TPA: hypothetical protein DCF44_07245 [Chitinophagaceae bacterium]|nr:hypothetical protein [Chitinophagaceae bacterium]